MIEIIASLRCDECKTLLHPTLTLYEKCTASDLAALHRRARGWARLRPRPAASMRDYCPSCLRELKAKGAK